MKRARIMLVTEAFHPAVAPATVTVRHLADQLGGLRAEVALVSGAPGLEVYRQHRVTRIRPVEPLGAQVRAALDEFRPDLVLTASPGPIGRKALKHAHRRGVVTATVEDAPGGALGLEGWQTKVAARSDVLLTVSRWQAEALTEHAIAATWWHPGVDADTFRPTTRSGSLRERWTRPHPGDSSSATAVVGFVGPLRRGHGVRRLVELGQLPGISLVVIGSGRQRDWLRSRLPRAHFLPDLATSDLAVAIASLDVLADPCQELTSAHHLRAAAASGVPVVAPRAGAAAEVVRHLETGLLFDLDRPLDFADEVAALAGDRSRDEFGRRARDVIRRRGWAEATDELVEQHLAPLLGHPLAA